jgi:hypothetical protein
VRACFDLRVAAEDTAEQLVKREVVAYRQGVGNDHLWHEGMQGFDFFAAVFVDIDEHVRRRQRAQFVDRKTLGAAKLRQPANDLSRMDAEAGAANEVLGEAKIDQQFGEAGHQRDDSRRIRVAIVSLADRVRPLHDWRFEVREAGGDKC